MRTRVYPCPVLFHLAAPMPENVHECPSLKNCLQIDCAAWFKNTLPVIRPPLSLLCSVKIHLYSIQCACVLQAFYTVFSRFVQMPKDTAPARQLSCRTPFA